MAQIQPSTGYRVDTHVHLYPGISTADMLDAARTNIGPQDAMLCLTETATLNRFAAMPHRDGNWSIAPTAEPLTRLAQHRDGSRIAVVAGRQIVTQGRLEVLALGLGTCPADGMPLDDTIAAITRENALAVLPWGVGKWTAERGTLIAELIQRHTDPRDIFLADSGVRPRLWPRPPLLKRAETAGWLCLAGSDPLPLPGDIANAGRYGIEVPEPLDPQTPFASFKAWLTAQTASPALYGGPSGTPRMIRNQILLRTPLRIKA